MSKTVEDIGTLKINLLSQAQYEAEVAGGTIEPNELYLTPSSGSGVADVEVNGESVVSGGVAEITINDIPSGGTTGQVLTKDSGTDYDVSWEDPSGGTITDVEVDGTSVVTGGVAEIDLTGKADVSHTHTKSQITDFPTIPTITDTYSSTSSNGMSGKAVKQAIDALDGTISGSAGAGKTLTALSQTDGKVSATFSNISITKSQVSDFPTIPTKVSDLVNDSGFVTTDTKNTAGSTQSTSKLYLIGATSQGANPQTYSNNWLYYDNGLYSKGESGDYLSYIKNTYNSANIYSSHYNDEASIDLTPNDIAISVDGVTTDTSIYLDDDKVEIRGNNGEEYITVTQDGKVTIDGVVTPTTNSMAVNKKYVDDLIPTVNNATLTIQKNGTTVDTFTANASSNVTANITVPTDTGDLTNGAGFITGVTSTSTPTASTIAEFDSSAHMNSTDMSSADVSAFVSSLGYTWTDEFVHRATPKYDIDTSAQTGTVDGDLYEAITDLNWDSDVIANLLLDVKKLLTKTLEFVKENTYTGYGTGTNITGYNSSSNKFTVPSNGIIILNCNYRSNNYVILYNENGDTLAEAASGGSANSAGNILVPISVYKGMKFYGTVSSSYSYLWYYPYV